MSKLDWERYKTREGLRTVVIVWIVCTVMYFAAVFIGYLPFLIEVDRWVYLADMAEITIDIFTTATGVVWGLSFFFVFLRSLLEVEERARRETVREEG